MSRSRGKTWKILSRNEPPFLGETINLTCDCGIEASCPTRPVTGAKVIAVLGMDVLFDPPGFIPPPEFLPLAIQCRYCRRAFGWTGWIEKDEKDPIAA